MLTNFSLEITFVVYLHTSLSLFPREVGKQAKRIAIINPRKAKLESELQDQQETELMLQFRSYVSQTVMRDLRDFRYMKLEG